jgi:hypothetical protein
MATLSSELSATHSPLEEFVRDYVEVTGGVWDEVEPQVYDVLLPSAEVRSVLPPDSREIVRITFDPEALPENPGAQLASFGSPLMDRLLADAVQRGRYAQFYLIGLNLTPHDLAGRVRRALTLPPDLSLRVERVRPLHFAQAVFWFQAEFVSDQKEQEILPVALDLHYGRQVRHLDQLLDPGRLAAAPAQPLPEVRHSSVAAAYPLAREQVLRTFAAMANSRSRELNERLERQIARMARYYADMRAELAEQQRRSRSHEEDATKWAARREALEREERMRVAELRQKSTLRVRLRLLNLLVVQQPKLLLRCTALSSERVVDTLELVWDPLLEALEAAPCPICQRPTFAFGLTRQGRLVCPACLAASPARGK